MRKTYLRKMLSRLLALMLTLSLLPAFSLTAHAADKEITVKVRVTATPKSGGTPVGVNGAWVNVYFGQGRNGDNVKYRGSFVTKTVDGVEGYAECKLTVPAEEAANENKLNNYLAKFTFSASKTVASGKGINGNARDALFDVYQEDRLQLELHSETIDYNGNWLGEKLPLGNGKDVDLAFVVDVSGSMQNTINNVKNNIRTFSKYLADEGLNLRIAVIEYNSKPEDTHVFGVDKMADSLEHTVWLTDVDRMEDILGSMKAGGGDKEVPIDGLGYLVHHGTMRWRSSAHKFAFLLTDENGNDDANNRWGYTNMDDLAALLKEEGVTTSVVTKTSADFENTYGVLYKTTGGMRVDINSSNFAEKMIEMADSIIGKVEKELTLELSEPRLLVDLSVCYYANTDYTKGTDGGNDEYYNNIKKALKDYSSDIAEATDGHVLINKVYVFTTDNRQNFYISPFSKNPPISAMADIRIETRGLDWSDYSDYDGEIFYNTPESGYSEPIIHSNANTGGFFSADSYGGTLGGNSQLSRFSNLSDDEIDALNGKKTFNRIQLSYTTEEDRSVNVTNLYDKQLTHESGHYIMTLYDEYINGNEVYWDNRIDNPTEENSAIRPQGAGDNQNFGLMDDQFNSIELSKAYDYAYLGGNYSTDEINTRQSKMHQKSAEDTLAELLENGRLTIRDGWFGSEKKHEYFDTGEYAVKYTKAVDHDRTAKYDFARIGDDDIIDLRRTLRPTASGTSATTPVHQPFIQRVPVYESLADIFTLINENGGLDLNINPLTRGDVSVYSRLNGASSPTLLNMLNGVADLNLGEGESAEVTVVAEEGGKYLSNQYLIERSERSADGYFYEAVDGTGLAYVIPSAENSYTFIT
ncbi:MAG: VWA domain-containing protein, partial [Oscillospiraceae bacterium]|nr:VWA domain-containing protein [Oscillospiraceae bacterium]